MNRFSIFTLTVATVLFVGCSQNIKSFDPVDSLSFPENQVVIQPQLAERLLPDSAVIESHWGILSGKVDEVQALADDFQKNPSDSAWQTIIKKWTDLIPLSEAEKDSISPVSSLQKWAKLNMALLKISGDIKFADALDNLVYNEPVPVLTVAILKSFIYTHVDDQIFVNFFGDSELTHHHTTGGTMKFSQQTTYPDGNEIHLLVEGDDTRFMDVFIRIPEWAVNPTVNHGNVKYVAHPAEYCEISRKWKTGDEIVIRLKN